MKPKAYEGKENYIFISYAHRDSDLVFQVMESLQKEGYRIWYDDGIVPGSEWPENIAQHLNDAAMVIAMITPFSMESHNCRREINFALSRRKPFLSVVLQPTEMSLGMEMQLSAQRSILRYNYDNWDDFIDRILTCPDLAPCKIPDAEPAAASSATVASAPEKAAVSAAPVVVKNVTEAVVPAAPAPKKKAEKPKEPKVKKEKAPRTRPAKDGKGKGLSKLLPIVALAALVLVVGGLLIRGFTTAKTSWGETISKNDVSVRFYEETVTQEDLEIIAGMEKLKTIDFDGCDFSACDFKNVRFVSEILQDISIQDCTGINDFTFLSGHTLHWFTLTNDKSFTDLGVLNCKEMSKLDIRGTGVSDLTSLRGTPINTLYIDNTNVANVDALAELPKLWELSAANCNITDIHPLSKLEELEKLNFSGCPVNAVTEPFLSLGLYNLRFAQCGITDLSGFANCTRLSELVLYGNEGLTDLSWLDAQNYDTLRNLYLSGTGLDWADVEFIANCQALEKLTVSGIPLENLDFCKNLTNLKMIRGENCGIKDITGLSGCPKLAIAMLSHNSIASIKGLEELTPSRSVTVDVMFNNISDVSALKDGEYRTLLLCGNDPNLAMTVGDGISAYNVAVDWCEGITESAFATQRGQWSDVYLVGCPANRLLDCQDALGSVFLNPVDLSVLLMLLAENRLDYGFDIDYRYPYSLYEGA